MPNRKGEPNNPNRRIAPPGSVNSETLDRLSKARYTGVCYHKRQRSPDYGFAPRPRPNKSLCDDLRPISISEATRLFRSGIRLGMVSEYMEHGLPKVVWAVDDDGEAYQAMLGGDGVSYHGHRLNRKEPNREYVIAEWRKRSA